MNKTTMKCQRCGGTGKVQDPRLLGAAKRKARETAGVTLRSLAKAMTFTAAYISDLELGRREWSNGMSEHYDECLKKLSRK